MRYRRRKVYRRKPVRRVRRSRRVVRRRRRPSSNLFCKLTKISIYSTDNSKNEYLQLGFKPDDFPEYVSLAKNFQYVKFLKMRVTILPLQNVANSSTSIMTSYVMTPWHMDNALPTDFNAYLSLDRAKVYRGTQVGYQTYVPSTFLYSSSTANQASGPNVIDWRPTIRTVKAEASGSNFYLPYIYGGVAAFQGSPDIINKSAAYNVKYDVYCKFISQTTMNV